MANVTKLLIQEGIVEYMTAMGFTMEESKDSKGNSTLWFQYSTPYEKLVMFQNGGRISCRLWNDEEDAPRYCTALEVIKSNPTLQEWQLLMHVGGIVNIPELEIHLATQNSMV